jgi:hypothetical protein
MIPVFVDNIADSVVGGSGIDTVQSSVTYTVGDTFCRQSNSDRASGP